MKTTQFLGENIGLNLCDLGSDNGFLDMTPEALVTKEEKKNWTS